MTTICMTTKSKKIGNRNITDSLTPRRFRKIRPKMKNTWAKILYGWSVAGRKLNSASALLAIEIVIVNM